MADDKATRVSLSIFESDLKQVNDFATKYKIKFNSQAAVFRHILRGFFKQQRKDINNDLILYFIFPFSIGAIATFGTLSTQSLIDILTEKGLYFAELHNLNRIFVILGAFSVGLFFACVVWLRKKYYS